ncbi:MAG: Gfo/Idh/MocA family oxidoreductase [Acidobacteria bacterium]|nr:Gfo/Idh/MocA family oxidoreductase [Acidobacteriota bacterium]
MNTIHADSRCHSTSEHIGSKESGTSPPDQTDVSRRRFLAASGSALAASSGFAQAKSKKRIALVGTGDRGVHWGGDLVKNYSDVATLAALCDINAKRVNVAREMMGADAPTYVDFDKMVKETNPDLVLVTTPDSTHYTHIIRAMELGKDVLTEKPLCTDETQAQAILDAEKKYGRKLIVAFNARHYAKAKKIKQLMQEKAIGDVISIDYQEYLNTAHGGSYFRRWHRIKEMSGTLLVSKSCHHFDQVNWWLDSTPVEVMAWGDLKFYGRNNPFRSTHCRVCPYKQRCQFYWDVSNSPHSMKLYVGCESEDGYLIDGCVWRQDINIYDTFSVMVKYANGARLTYTANTFMPYEGQEIGINGSRGRIDFNMYEGGKGAASDEYSDFQLRMTKTHGLLLGKSELVTDLPQRAGGHGGADPSLRDLIFREWDQPDPLGLRASSLAGAQASLVGIAAYRSIERGGERVKLSDLAKL